MIVAAGRGTRLGGPKQFIELAGLPMVGWSMRTFAAMPEIAELVVATEPEIDRSDARALRSRRAGTHLLRRARRRDAAAERLRRIARGLGARAMRSSFTMARVRSLRIEDVRAGMREVRNGRAALLAQPVVDTIKQVDRASLRVGATLDRATLWAAQTPQFATLGDLRAAHERALRDGVRSDRRRGAARAHRGRGRRRSVDGENFKVTLPADVARADAILRARATRVSC